MGGKAHLGGPQRQLHQNCGTNELLKSAPWQAKESTNSEVRQIWVQLLITYLTLDKLFISRGSLSSPIKLG